MILDTTKRSIQLLLAGAAATTYPQWTAHWAEHGDGPPETFDVGALRGQFTATALQQMAVPAPGANLRRQLKTLTVYNPDTAAVTVSVLYVDATGSPTTSDPAFKATLQPGQQLQYTYEEGFSVRDSGGAEKAPSFAAPAFDVEGIVLDTTTRKLQILLGGAVATTQPAYVTSYVDIGTLGATIGGSNGATNSGTAVDAVAAPASGNQRIVKLITLYNEDTASVVATVRYNDNGTTRTLFKGTLLAGQELVYTSTSGFQVLDSGGALKSPQGGAACPIEPGGLVNSSDLPTIAGVALTNGTIYWVYIGRTTRAIQGNFVEFAVGVAGAGAQTAEAAIASTPAAPKKAGQTLTVLASTGTVDALTGTGVLRNTNDFAISIAAGTHLWVGLRTAMATTQPTIEGLTKDYAQARIMRTAGVGPITGSGTWSGAVIAHSLAWQAPDLRFICT